MKIKLGGKEANGRYALVDDADAALVAGYAWRYSLTRATPPHYPYVVATVAGQSHVALARLITGTVKASRKTMITYRDGDLLNCQRSNLLVGDSQSSAAHSRKRKNCSSEYKGVTKRRCGRITAHIRVDYELMHLGSFTDEEEAARAYDKAALKYFGDAARTNFPKEDYKDEKL